MQGLSPQAKSILYLYTASPTLLVGIGSGLILGTLFFLTHWGSHGRWKDPFQQNASFNAFPIALLALCMGVGFTLGFYSMNQPLNRSYGAYLWLLPNLAIAAYLWHILRLFFIYVDHRFQKQISGWIALTLFAFGGIGIYVMASKDIKSQLLSWPFALVFIYPLLVCTGMLIHRILVPSQAFHKGLLRGGFILLMIGWVGVHDLSESMHQLPRQVKSSLVEGKLMSTSLIKWLQQFYDQDGDGIAGKMGGSDCDDERADIHPNAVEIPLNGVDEDCHEGDSLIGTIQKNRLGRYRKINYAHANSDRELVKKPNIVLITIDTLRADHLGYHGYSNKTSPFLDSLAKRGLQFRWAFSTGAQTRISMPAVFSGVYCSELARSTPNWAKIYQDNLMLAERLSAARYHTVGIPSHNYFNPMYGLNQGFKEWNFSVVNQFKKQSDQGTENQIGFYPSGHLVTDAAVEWVETRLKSKDDQPFFLWLHYFDPHHLYMNHPDLHFGTRPIDLYDEEILYTDRQIERFFDEIESSAFADNTYFIIHSDHGEGFNERGMKYRYHGQSLYNDQVHVPLLVVGPHVPFTRVETPTSIIDIPPTILDLAGVDYLRHEMRGESLLKFIDQPQAKHHPIFVEMLKDSSHDSAQYAVVDWPWKLKYIEEFNTYKLFNLSNDIYERADHSDTYPDTFKRLQKRLLRWKSDELKALSPFNRRAVPQK
jgi:arylsulfatase A-like enzyme